MPRARRRLRRARGLHGQLLPLQARAQEGLLRRADRPGCTQSLFSADERAVIQAHVPWTRVLDDVDTQKGEWHGDLLELARAWREHLVIKPNDEYGGKGVNLGWEMTEGEWDAAIESALEDPYGTWIVQERIPVRREVFPQFDAAGRISMDDMLVDLAPYLFRGRMGGYLTRLSATGLANVTSGGGQVPAFVVGE